MNNYTIYAHKNKINGKLYIGQTCQKPEYRWNNGKHYQNCTAFNRAIQKYGWDSFEHIILFQNLTKEEANQLEIELIQQYDTTNREYGYNCQAGGNDKSLSQEGKEKIIESLHQRWSDEEYKKYFSDLMKEKWKNPEYRERCLKGCEKARQKHFDETGSRCFMTEDGRKKVSEARKEYMNTHKDKYSHKVRCINTGQEFNSYLEAAKWAKVDSSGFSKYFAPNSKAKSLGKHPETGEKLQWERI